MKRSRKIIRLDKLQAAVLILSIIAGFVTSCILNFLI